MEFMKRMDHRKWLPLLVISMLLLMSIRIEAETPDAAEVLKQMVKSFQTVDFKGKATFMSMTPEGTQMREAIMVRKAPDKGFIKILFPLEEKGTMMGMNEDDRWFVPGGERKPRDRRFRPFPPPDRVGEMLRQNAQILLKNYNVQVFDGGSVAGRNTYLVEVESKSGVRPSAKLWVDEENGAILKMEHYDAQKRLRDLLVYSEIDFDAEIDDAIFQRPEKAKPERREPDHKRGRRELWNYRQRAFDLKKIREEAELDIIVPREVPGGFVLQKIQVLRFHRWRNIHLTYTDGLAVFSVFQSRESEHGRDERGERSPGGRRGGRPGKMEPPWRGGETEKMDIGGVECEIISRGPISIFRWNQSEIHITLMSDLERKEMIEIAESFIKS